MTGAPWPDVDAEHQHNDGWVEGPNNQNPWGEEQGAGDAAYCASAGCMVPYHHGVRFPSFAQFGEKGWAYCPYALSDMVRLGIWEDGHNVVIHAGDIVLMDWNGDGVADHWTTAISDELTGTGNVHTAEYNSGSPEGAHYGMWRPRKYVRGVGHFCRQYYVGGAAPAPAPAPTPTPPPPPPPAPSGDGNPFTPVLVDGQLGPYTIRALQWRLNLDGANPRLATDGVRGPATNRMIQARLNATNPPVAIDGAIGPQTIRALQTHVGAQVDGQWGPQTTACLQRSLNTAAF